MSFFGGSTNDDRRRRVLSDDRSGARADAVVDAPLSAQVRRRAAASGATQLAGHATIVDLVPQRMLSVLLLSLAGISVVAALEAAHYWMPELQQFAGGKHLAAIDLDGRNNLAVWFNSFSRGLVAVVALLIYVVRRHKPDDYNGKYRVWLWAAAAWMITSIDAVASLHEALQHVMDHFSGAWGPDEGAVWWVAGYALLLGPLCIRLALEMRCCLASTTVFLFALGCLGTSVGVRFGLLGAERNTVVVMVDGGGQLLGNVLLLIAMTLHARHVIRDSLGLIPATPKTDKATSSTAANKTKPAAATPASAASAAAKRSDLDLPRTATSTSAVHSRADDEEDELGDDHPRDQQRHRFDDEEDYVDGRKLNKAQRKALRRQKEQQRRALSD